MAYQSEHEITSDAFGLALSIIVFSNYQSSPERYSDYLTELYGNCRDLAFDDNAAHPENDIIFKLID